MDIITLSAAKQYAREVSGAVDVQAAKDAKEAAETAQGKAEDAQEAAEAAAESAKEHGFTLTLFANQDGTYTLVKGDNDNA